MSVPYESNEDSHFPVIMRLLHYKTPTLLCCLKHLQYGVILWQLVVLFGIFGTTTSSPCGSNNDSHFPVAMCLNALMKLYSLLLTIVNVPEYLELEMMSLSSVQFVILI